MFQEQIDDMYRKLEMFNPEKKILKKLDLFVMDNSLRETSFGQLRGHTLDNKWKIYDEVHKVGFKNVIVESFNHMTRMGDAFIRQLLGNNYHNVNYFAFTDFIEKIDDNKVPEDDELPIGLMKMKELGINNIIMELDLVYFGINYEIFNGPRLCNLLKQRFDWIRKNLSPRSMIFVNLRDFSECMVLNPRRLFYVVNFLASLPGNERIYGIAFEDAGKHMAEEVAVWTHCVRREMSKCGWVDGHLLVHIQEQFGMADLTQLDCLANGATGILAGLCEVGSSLGHASSCLTIMNLVRIGNKRVQKMYNCTKLREAARTITEISTGKPPPRTRPVIGSRALDVVFRRESLKFKHKKDFSLSDFLGDNLVVRITTASTPTMLMKKLESHYGIDVNFTHQRAQRMKQRMLEDRQNNKREEYNSCVGIALLYERAGGTLTNAMETAIGKAKDGSNHIEKLMQEIRELWDEWDIRDGVKDDEVDLDAFYNGFMAPYFGCYRTDETKTALRAIDVDADGQVHWDEFALYLRWAGSQYPDVETSEELLEISFRKGLVPAMQYEISKDMPINIYMEEGEDAPYYKQTAAEEDIAFVSQLMSSINALER